MASEAKKDVHNKLFVSCQTYAIWGILLVHFKPVPVIKMDLWLKKVKIKQLFIFIIYRDILYFQNEHS